MQDNIITIPPADDMHCHLRDGALLDTVIVETARQFRRAIIMPNLAKPVVNRARALAYRERILSSLEKQKALGQYPFEPLMTLYVTNNADLDDYRQAFLAGEVKAAKLYPAHATTNSAHGVSDVFALKPLLTQMSDMGMPLLIHGEVTDAHIDIFDREAEFIERTLKPLKQIYPDLKVVLEHISTRQAAEFVLQGDETIAATITPHHMLLNRNALFTNGLRPHHYCLPILKREAHRTAVTMAATSGHPRIFAGTDSAPHSQKAKLQACGCAGIYNGYEALGLYAEIFEAHDALEYLPDFLSRNGAKFYGLPLNQGEVSLIKQPVHVPERIHIGNQNGAENEDEVLIPFRAGEAIAWRLYQPSDGQPSDE